MGCRLPWHRCGVTCCFHEEWTEDEKKIEFIKNIPDPKYRKYMIKNLKLAKENDDNKKKKSKKSKSKKQLKSKSKSKSKGGKDHGSCFCDTFCHGKSMKSNQSFNAGKAQSWVAGNASKKAAHLVNHNDYFVHLYWLRYTYLLLYLLHIYCICIAYSLHI